MPPPYGGGGITIVAVALTYGGSCRRLHWKPLSDTIDGQNHRTTNEQAPARTPRHRTPLPPNDPTASIFYLIASQVSRRQCFIRTSSRLARSEHWADLRQIVTAIIQRRPATPASTWHKDHPPHRTTHDDACLQDTWSPAGAPYKRLQYTRTHPTTGRPDLRTGV